MATAVKLISEKPPHDVESKSCGEAPSHQKPELKNPSDDHHGQPEMASMFRKFWCATTDDSRLTLFGFRRFRTAHLLNLRFLEDEIHKIDHDIYQAGLQLGVPCTAADRLGLKHFRKDEGALGAEALIKPELISRLRDLLEQYDEKLIAFNQIMLMETFSLADHNGQSELRNDLNPYETFKTRLLRVDLPPRRDSRDLLRHSLRKCLRTIWFRCLSGRARDRNEQHDRSFSSASELESRLSNKSNQNTALIAESLTRFLVALLASAFLIVPLILLSLQSTNKAHLITVSMFIVIFTFLVSLLSKASNSETMAAAAAYAAVLVVFVSNSSGRYTTTT